MWYSALLIGFAGSLHCAGMCSPLVLAATARSPFLRNKLIYNFARIFVYACLGAFAAAAGSLFPVQLQQNGLSLFVGVVFLLLGVGFLKSVRISFLDRYAYRLTSFFRQIFRKQLARKSNATSLVLGAMNGLLPCGLTYLALANCVILPSAREGFLFMFIFGLGTWPVMIGFAWLTRNLLVRFNFSYRAVSASVFVLAGALLIARVLLPQHSAHETKQQVIGSATTIECK